MRFLHIMVLVVVVGGALVWMRGGDEERSADTAWGDRPATPVTPYVLAARPFQSQIRAQGTLRAWESVDITSSVSETVVELHFEDSAWVEKGQLLVTLMQEEEQASLREQQEVLREQEREVARLADLAAKNQVAQTELDQRRTLSAIARSKIEQMKARIEDRNIHAPFSGQLGLREVSPGALIAPGEVITTLDDVSRMRLDFTVPATHLEFLEVGQQVEANSAAFVESFSGVLAAVGSRVDRVNRSVTARAHLDNPDGRLKPGLLMTVVLVDARRQALLLPEESLLSRIDTHYAWRIEGNTARRVEVDIGGRVPGWVEITSGLNEGDTIVRDGVVRLRGNEATVEILDN